MTRDAAWTPVMSAPFLCMATQLKCMVYTVSMPGKSRSNAPADRTRPGLGAGRPASPRTASVADPRGDRRRDGGARGRRRHRGGQHAAVAARVGSRRWRCTGTWRRRTTVFLAVDAAAGYPPPAPRPSEAWRAAAERWARRPVGVARRHPWVARVPITEPPSGPPGGAGWSAASSASPVAACRRSTSSASLNLIAGFVLGHFRLYDELAAVPRTAG